MAFAFTFNMGLIAPNIYIKIVKAALYIKFFPGKAVDVVWLILVLSARLSDQFLECELFYKWN